MTKVSNVSRASFRDPAGFIFTDNGTVKRAVTQHGKKDYDFFISSGLYRGLLERGWIVSHTEDTESVPEGLFKILTPQKIDTWTFPYEWSFSQLKDAAILTLNIQLLALEFGMCLKDATPFNIQFYEGRPLFIDTLSFEMFQERPWFGYKQFCEMFLAPLVLMANKREDFNRLLAVDLSGINLSFASKLLPRRTWFSFSYLTHIHLHAASQAHFEDSKPQAQKPKSSLKFYKINVVSFVDNLLSCIHKIKIKRKKTAFSDYYADCGHYGPESERFKMDTVRRWAQAAKWQRVMDLGGNTGKYSRVLNELGIFCVCADYDPYCVDENYLLSKKEQNKKMLPILLDISNPPSDLGWANEERPALFKRVAPDAVLSLALVHHLRISAGIPLELIARFFARVAPSLIIEFVPKEDVMVQKLLRHRDDIFFDYDQTGFERVFADLYSFVETVPISGTKRTLYLMKRK